MDCDDDDDDDDDGDERDRCKQCKCTERSAVTEIDMTCLCP